MGKLSIVEYSGKDAGEVLMNILNGYREAEMQEVESDLDVDTERVVGFQPNPETEEEEHDGPAD